MTTQLPNDLQLDNAFWQFSLAFWQNKKAQEALLRLQDNQYLRVNLLLFSMWLGLERKPICDHLQTLIESTENWHQTVVQPLREVRKALPINVSTPTLKPQVQNSELIAEQVEQSILYKCAWNIPAINSKKNAPPPPKDTPNTLFILAQNLITCANHAQTVRQLTSNVNQQHKKSSTLSTSDLLLLIQTCLPDYPRKHISQCIDILTPQQ